MKIVSYNNSFFFLLIEPSPLCRFIVGWPNVPKVELEISTPLQIEVLNEMSAWLKL